MAHTKLAKGVVRSVGSGPQPREKIFNASNITHDVTDTAYLSNQDSSLVIIICQDMLT